MKTAVTLSLLLVTSGLAVAEEYDYFRNIQYPPVRRPDVALDKIEQEGGPDAVGYKKRVVTWWPKKGVDYVDPPAGVPLRTWTIRTPEMVPLVEAGVFAKWWPQDLQGKKQFKAYLIGFRGIGSDYDIPYFDPGRVSVQGRSWCPAVVLRLEDGRKRCFTRGSLSDEDQEYILDLYEKEMARVHKTLEPAPTQIPPDIANRYPVGELYKPGTYRIEGERFVISSGSEEPNDGIPGVWINKAREKDAFAHHDATLRMFEDYWAYNEYSGHLMPFWERPAQYKYSVVYGGTLVNGIELIGRGNGGGYGGCGTACWEGLCHEWGHGCATDPMVLLGGGETRCDGLQTMADPSLVRKVSFGIQRPYKNFFWGQYPGAFGYTMMADDPNWGYGSVTSWTSLMADVENTPMHVIARLGQERGIWENGIKGMGDLMGQIGARYAEYDYELEGMLREAYPQPNRAYLVPVDRARGIYRSTRTEAPEPFGVNVIRLSAEPGAKKITVDFRGFFDPDTYSDWRVCIVAVGKDGRPRYTPLWNKGVMSMDIKDGDKRFWLTVTATPYALVQGQESNGGDRVNHVYQGGFTYKYPYEVQLAGCKPASPHAPIGDNENMELVGPSLFARADANFDNCGLGDWPHPSDTPDYARMKQTLEALVEKAPVMIERYMEDGVLTDAQFCPIANRPINRQTALASAVFLGWRAQWLLDNAQGARHPNGGGWVASSAQVAPTAYVGPECMVLDGAQVLDNAIIEDYAIVSGPKVLVKDNSRVYGKAVVCGDVTLSGYARVYRSIINRASKIEFYKEDGNVPPCNFQMVTGVPVKRDGPEERVQVFKNAGFKLQANYAFDREETILLEDWYQEHSLAAFAFGAHSSDLIFYDGLLYGRPGFVKDGDIRAFTFNGKDQFAEADPAVADLGEITIDLSVKWDGGGQQTLFDFGSSTKNRFMLTVDRAGTPALVTVKDGKTESLRGNGRLARGVWCTFRVEMDGSKTALWLNSRKIAERTSDYRAADAFPAGVEKRNFIAATRDQKEFFKGSIDYVRVYYTVYDDFARAPEPPMVSSRRISSDFMDEFNQRYADYEARESGYRDAVRRTDIYRFYEEWVKRVDARIAELGQCEEVASLEQEVKDLQMRYETRRSELGAEFDRNPVNVEKRKKYEELEKQRWDRFREMQQASAEWVAAQKEEQEAGKLRQEIEQAARKTLEAELKAIQEKRGGIEKRRGEYLDQLQKTDEQLLKNREKRQAVLDELQKISQESDQKRLDELRNEERLLNDEFGRRRDLLLREDPNWKVLEQEIQAVNQDEWSMIQVECNKDVRYGQAATVQENCRRTMGQIDNSFWSNAELVKLEAERNKHEVRFERDQYMNSQTSHIPAQIGKVQAKIKELRVQTALENYPDEYQALVSLDWGKGQYRTVIEDRMKSQLLSLMPEDKKQMREAAPFQMSKWSTTVDWDGRTRWEKSGGELQPLLARWLKRMKPYEYD